MKVILGRTGGGKTRKISELAAKLSSKGEKSLYITSETSFEEYGMSVMSYDNVHLENLRYAYRSFLEDVLEEIYSEENKEFKTVFVDVVPSFLQSSHREMSHQETTQYMLDKLSDAESELKKNIYVTVQVKYDDSRVEDERYVTLDYERFSLKK